MATVIKSECAGDSESTPAERLNACVEEYEYYRRLSRCALHSIGDEESKLILKDQAELSLYTLQRLGSTLLELDSSITLVIDESLPKKTITTSMRPHTLRDNHSLARIFHADQISINYSNGLLVAEDNLTKKTVYTDLSRIHAKDI